MRSPEGMLLTIKCFPLLDPFIGSCRISPFKLTTIFYFSFFFLILFWQGLGQCVLKNEVNHDEIWVVCLWQTVLLLLQDQSQNLIKVTSLLHWTICRTIPLIPSKILGFLQSISLRQIRLDDIVSSGNHVHLYMRINAPNVLRCGHILLHLGACCW